jgi:ABC-type glutathione transport system ATPase component
MPPTGAVEPLFSLRHVGVERGWRQSSVGLPQPPAPRHGGAASSRGARSGMRRTRGDDAVERRQQRSSLARALMTRPELSLLDEPMSALDPEASLHLLATVARLADEQPSSTVPHGPGG